MSSAATAREITSDWSLLERIGQKDEEALSALYDRYGGLVFSEAKRILRNTGAAEEVLQDLFLQVWRTAERFGAGKGSLAGWLLVAARNHAISRLKRKSGRTEELDENGVVLHVNVELPESQRVLVAKVRAVMKRLAKQDRQALEYGYFEGLSCSEIAEETGQGPEAVKLGICSALEALRKVAG